MQVPTQVRKAPWWLKVLGFGLAGLIFAPIAFTMLYGMVALVVTVILAMTGIFFGPVLAEKMANWKMMGLTNEWKKSPVPTLQRQYAERADNLEQRKKALAMSMAAIADFNTLRANFKARFPKSTDKIALYDERAKRLQASENMKKAKYQAAADSLAKFGETVIEAEADWEVILALKKANQLEEMDNDPMELLKTRTSLGSVEREMNECFAQLDVAMLDTPKIEPILIEAEHVEVLPSSIPSKESVKLPR
jgi:hypothetical protein